MRDPKLALAIAIHQGAIALMVDHGAGSMDRVTAVNRSRQVMEKVVGERETAWKDTSGDKEVAHGLDVSLSGIEAEFANGRFYAGEGGRERFMDGLAG